MGAQQMVTLIVKSIIAFSFKDFSVTIKAYSNQGGNWLLKSHPTRRWYSPAYISILLCSSEPCVSSTTSLCTHKTLPIERDSNPVRWAGAIQLLFFNQTPIFDWCGVRWGSKNKYRRETCLKEIGLHFKFILCTPQPQLGGPMYWVKGINK